MSKTDHSSGLEQTAFVARPEAGPLDPRTVTICLSGTKGQKDSFVHNIYDI